MAKESKQLLTKKENNLLKKIYFDPKVGYSSANTLKERSNLPIRKVKQFLRTVRAYTLHRPSRKQFPRRWLVIPSELYYQVGIDLIVYNNISHQNDGFKYILVMMDSLSKKSHARPLKSKNTDDIKKAITSIIDTEILPLKIRFIHGDREGGFIATSLKDYLLKKYGIKIFYSENSDTKCFLIERFIRTLKTHLARYMTHYNNYRWIDVLQDIVENYNNTHHRTIKMSPNSVKPGAIAELAWGNMESQKVDRIMKTMGKNNFSYYSKKTGKIVSNRPKPKFKIGDHIRISLERNKYSRGFTPNYSEIVYRITEVKYRGLLYTYVIENPTEPEDKTITGHWYAFEMIHASRPTEYIIRDILDVKVLNGKTYALTAWEGYPLKRHNTWRLINEKEINSLQETHEKLYKKLKPAPKVRRKKAHI